MSNLSGRTALITGGTQGVGSAIAKALAKNGANVVIHGIEDSELAQATLDACREFGIDAQLVLGNLIEPTPQCFNELFVKATQANGDIDLLVNNAGVYIDTPFLEMPFDTFDRTMKLNVYAYYFMTQHFAQRWQQRSTPGRVLMVGSINGQLAEEVHTAYDTSKGAVEMMVRSLCVSLAPLGIRVNGISPGLFYTPLTAPAIDQPHFKKWMELHTPNGKVPGPEVCGETAAFLLSDAAEHIHGQMLRVDGGMSVWQQPDPPLS